MATIIQRWRYSTLIYEVQYIAGTEIFFTLQEAKNFCKAHQLKFDIFLGGW
jgi:hypothetical protein